MARIGNLLSMYLGDIIILIVIIIIHCIFLLSILGIFEYDAFIDDVFNVSFSTKLSRNQRYNENIPKE